MDIIGNTSLQNKLTQILNIFIYSNAKIRPHFWLTGGSGSGKTHIVNALCKKLGLNFLSVNCAGITKEGFSGNSLSKVLTPLEFAQNAPTVIFMDEVDKLFISGNTNTPTTVTCVEGIQNELLTMLESETTSVIGDYGKYKKVSVNNCLFVFAGAFNGQLGIKASDLIGFGVKTELLGRVNLVYETEPVTKEILLAVLDTLELVNDYASLMRCDKQVIIDHVRGVLSESSGAGTIGVRQLSAIIHQYFIEKEA